MGFGALGVSMGLLFQIAAQFSNTQTILPCPNSFSGMPHGLRVMNQMRPAIEESFEQSIPYWGASGATGVFATSYDYHSSVHAHWALLKIADELGDSELAARIENRFTDNVLRSELEFLRDMEPYRYFELPYGRSWLLILLSELRNRPRFSQSEVIVEFIEFLYKDLKWYLENTLLPERGVHGFTGGHFSFLFNLTWILQFEEAHGSSSDLENQVTRAYAYHDQIWESVEEAQAFMRPVSIYALLDRFFTKKAQGSFPYPLETTPELPPITDLNSHLAGKEVTRNWIYAFQSHLGSRQACIHFRNQMDRVMARDDLWRHSYQGVQHWVPQMIFAGLMLEKYGSLIHFH